VAGLFERGYQVRGKRVGVILSGGNVDPAMLKDWL
jgi:threonine dehydratase